MQDKEFLFLLIYFGVICIGSFFLMVMGIAYVYEKFIKYANKRREHKKIVNERMEAAVFGLKSCDTVNEETIESIFQKNSITSLEEKCYVLRCFVALKYRHRVSCIPIDYKMLVQNVIAIKNYLPPTES